MSIENKGPSLAWEELLAANDLVGRLLHTEEDGDDYLGIIVAVQFVPGKEIYFRVDGGNVLQWDEGNKAWRKMDVLLTTSVGGSFMDNCEMFYPTVADDGCISFCIPLIGSGTIYPAGTDLEELKAKLVYPQAPLPALTEEHMDRVCRTGEGAATCRYLIFSVEGFSCEKNGRLASKINELSAASKMTAQGDNCKGRTGYFSKKPAEQ